MYNLAISLILKVNVVVAIVFKSNAVQPLSNYIKREKAQGNSAYGYAVNSNYAMKRFGARH